MLFAMALEMTRNGLPPKRTIIRRYKNAAKNMLPVLICFGFLFFILHDTQLGLPPESHTEAQPLTNIMGECLANRTLLREAIENNGSHLMKGFTCALLKNDLHESACRAEDENSKVFFKDERVRKRLQMLTPSMEYFHTIDTVAFKPVSNEEKKNPIAFSIMSHSNLGVLEALLASMFRRHNSYCIYVDNKASDDYVNNVRRLINAYKMKFSEAQIFLAKEPRMNIYWGSNTLLEAPLSCMEQLLELPPGPFGEWKYFMNLVGTALPTISVLDLAKVMAKLNPGQDIVMSEKMPPEKEKLQTHKYTMMDQSDNNGIDLKNQNLEGKDGSYLQSDVPIKTDVPKEDPPHNLRIRWGWTESIISRETADLILHNPIVQDLRNWVKDVFFPEEFFYATLSTINKRELRKGRVVQDLNKDTNHGICVRKSLWIEEYDKCHGQVKRGICNLNLGDLPAVFKSGCLFANKFDLMASDSRVVKCMHEYLTQ